MAYNFTKGEKLFDFTTFSFTSFLRSQCLNIFGFPFVEDDGVAIGLCNETLNVVISQVNPSILCLKMDDTKAIKLKSIIVSDLKVTGLDFIKIFLRGRGEYDLVKRIQDPDFVFTSGTNKYSWKSEPFMEMDQTSSENSGIMAYHGYGLSPILFVSEQLESKCRCCYY